MTGSLAGRTVLVTGGNRGIGLGLATGVASAGATVVIWGRDEKANAVACQQLQAVGAHAAAVACDVSDPAAVAAAFPETVALAGPVHAVFANAGTSARFAPFHEQTDEEWRRVLDVNLGGAVHTLRAAVTHMVEHGEGGALVGVASMAAAIGMRNYSPYAASKAALVALMQTLAVEYARKSIRSNVIVPGWIETDMTAATPDRLREQVTRRTPAARFGTPEDFQAAAVFLADPAARFHTGDTIVIDGGYLKI